MPKYMLLINGSCEGGPPPEEMPRQVKAWEAYTRSLHEAGVHLADHRLAAPETATTIRVRDGETLIADGPFAETKEFLAGYYLVECDDLDAAMAHAARAPIVTYGSVEVRPVMEAQQA